MAHPPPTPRAVEESAAAYALTGSIAKAGALIRRSSQTIRRHVKHYSSLSPQYKLAEERGYASVTAACLEILADRLHELTPMQAMTCAAIATDKRLANQSAGMPQTLNQVNIQVNVDQSGADPLGIGRKLLPVESPKTV